MSHLGMIIDRWRRVSRLVRAHDLTKESLGKEVSYYN